MKQFEMLLDKEVFPGSDIMLSFTFKTMVAGDSYAHLSVENHQLAMNFAVLRERSAHFRKQDCFECLSPCDIAA